MSQRIEYRGFTNTGSTREYKLRVVEGTEVARDFVMVIANDAFTAQQARYQDGPDICYQALLKTLESSSELPGDRISLSNDDLQDYRRDHSAKPQGRRKAKRPAAVAQPLAPAAVPRPWRP